MKHAERCDRTTYCGRPIWSSAQGTPPPRGCITTYDCFTDQRGYDKKPLPEDMCGRCRKGLTDGKPWPRCTPVSTDTKPAADPDRT